MANTSIRSPEKAEALIAALEEHGSYKRAATKCRVSRDAFKRWRFDDLAFGERCAAARERGIDANGDEIEETFIDVAKNPKHPGYVTAAIFALKKLKPDRYGDKASLNIGGDDGASLTITLAMRPDGPQ